MYDYHQEALTSHLFLAGPSYSGTYIMSHEKSFKAQTCYNVPVTQFQISWPISVIKAHMHRNKTKFNFPFVRNWPLNQLILRCAHAEVTVSTSHLGWIETRRLHFNCGIKWQLPPDNYNNNSWYLRHTPLNSPWPGNPYTCHHWLRQLSFAYSVQSRYPNQYWITFAKRHKWINFNSDWFSWV